MRITAITQARSGSTRLPEKIFLQIGEQSLLHIHVGRLLRSKMINELIIATTTRPEDSRVCEVAEKVKVGCYQGSENDVLDRFYQACKDRRPDYVVRVTSDCPLVDPQLIDSVIEAAIREKADYCSNVLVETFPDGQDIEVFTFAALERAWKDASLASDREHVTPFIRRNCNINGGNLFTGYNVKAEQNYSDIRMTVDEMADFEVIGDVVARLGTERSWQEYADCIRADKKILEKNAHIKRNEGYIKSTQSDKK